MFLLLLMGLGAAGVKAQVRIGGNGAPNAAAVLDLNATDATTGTKGLALPRVALTSNTMLLPGVTQNLTGMLVYNMSTTGTGVNRIGIYYWDGATWVMASLPPTSAADSGYFLVSDGSSYHLAGEAFAVLNGLTATFTPDGNATTWVKQGTYTVNLPATSQGTIFVVTAPSLNVNDLCNITWGLPSATAIAGPGVLYISNPSSSQAQQQTISCYTPSR